jgi:dTDP-glucose pyrophosphorylase
MSASSPKSPGGSEPRWRKAMLPATATLREAIGNLNDSALQIVLVVGEGDALVGALTDGDIRRGLLRGVDLGAAIASLMTREPLVVPQAMPRHAVLQLMQTNRIHQLPVVDQQRRVVGLHLWDEMSAPGRRPNLMVIMAGGRGTRLRPQTAECPKPLLPVAGKPMLEHIVERAKNDGFSRFVLTINYLGQMIEDYFGDGSRLGVQIEYVREKSALGTAGAIALLEPRPAQAFLVSNGDVLTDIRYGELLEFHTRNAAAATMAVRVHEWQHPFGVVRTSGVDIVALDEKPVARTHINAGIYVLEPACVDELRVGEACDMPALFVRLKERGARTIAYPMHEPWLDVGRQADLERAYSFGAPGPGTNGR